MPRRQGLKPQGEEAQQSKKRKKVEEKAPDAVIRITALAISESSTNEPDLDPQNRSLDTLEQEWLVTLAQHLVREPAFLKVMENPPDASASLVVSSKFLASVHLERRYKMYKDFNSFLRKHKDLIGEVIDKAKAILDEALGGLTQTDMEKTRIPAPPNDEESQSLREAIFFYQILRNRAIEAIKSMSDREYLLCRELFSAYKETTQAKPGRIEPLVDELVGLDDAKQEIRELLRSTSSEKTGKAMLDQLLAQVPDATSNIFDLAQDVVENGLEPAAAQGPNDQVVSTQDKIQSINSVSPATIRFYDQSVSGKDDVFMVHYRDKQKQEQKQSVNLDVESKIEKLDSVSFDELDKTVRDGIVVNAQTLDTQRFRLNMEAFEKIVERPAAVKDQPYVSDDESFLLLKDNLFHVKVLVGQLRNNQLLQPDIPDAELQALLRRMWALVAIMYGCVPEGSLWLTVMDSLLEDLARMVRGQVDPRLNTAKMQRLKQSQYVGERQSIAALSSADIESLERDDLASRLFAELSRFYRGAVLLAYAAVSWKRKTNDKRGAEWYGELLRLSHICADESCIERLEVRQLSSATADEKSVDPAVMDSGQAPTEGKSSDKTKKNAKKAEGNRDGIISRSKFGISVGIADARLGLPAERAEISKNREWAYPCVYTLIRDSKWHPGMGPFFHYFGHLYHASCQSSRGKAAFILTVDSTVADGS